MKRAILVTMVGLLGLTALAQEDKGDEKVIKTKRVKVEVRELNGEKDTIRTEEEIVMEEIEMEVEAEIEAKMEMVKEILKEALGDLDSIEGIEDLEKLENLEKLEKLEELEELEELIEKRVEMQMGMHMNDSAHGPAKPRKPKLVETNMWVLDWGFNNLMAGSSLDMPEGFESWGLQSRSANFHLGVIQQGINLIKGKLRLVYGAGIEFNNYRFENGVTISKGVSPVEFEVNEEREYRTNKITSQYLTVPLMLNFKSAPNNEDKSLKLAAGVQGGYLLGSHQKLKWGKRPDKEKSKTKGDYGFADYRYGYVAQVGYGDFVLYGKYYPTATFKDNRGPEVNTACVGFVISPF